MSDNAATQFLSFSLGSEVFGMDIRTVREIIQHGSITPVPLMPDFVRGIINLRGAVVPVIDLHARFGRPAANIGKKSCIIIFDASRQGERAEIGLLVDAVSEVVEIPADQIEPVPDFGTSVRREFMRGIGKLQGRFIVLLEPDQAFNVEEMAQLCEAPRLAA